MKLSTQNKFDLALAQSEQEPVAYSITYNGSHCKNFFSNKLLAEAELKRLNDRYGSACRTLIPLYPSPPQRTWVGLTDEETERLIHNFGADPWTLLDEVNARLKARNT
jgi:hypothetical protein